MRDLPAVDARGRVRPGEGDGDAAPRPDGEAAEEHLEGGPVRRVTDEPGPEPVRAAVGGPGPPDAERRQARAPLVLDEAERAGGEHLERRAHGAAVTSTKRTEVPGVSSAGGSRCSSQSTRAVVPSSCQPPGDARG